jgi:hypothetical protein
VCHAGGGKAPVYLQSAAGHDGDALGQIGGWPLSDKVKVNGRVAEEQIAYGPARQVQVEAKLRGSSDGRCEGVSLIFVESVVEAREKPIR